MEQRKQPVEQYYYSEEEWSRLGCGPLPAERDRARLLQEVHAKGNSKVDEKLVQSYN